MRRGEEWEERRDLPAATQARSHIDEPSFQCSRCTLQATCSALLPKARTRVRRPSPIERLGLLHFGAAQDAESLAGLLVSPLTAP